MNKVLLIFIFLLTSNCSKPKTVFICGDHICVNKAEAKSYFENNLTLEVQVIDKKINATIDLVELNLNNNSVNTKKNISITQKNNTANELKVLSNDEIKQIKDKIKKSQKNKKVVKKIDNKNQNDNLKKKMILK